MAKDLKAEFDERRARIVHGMQEYLAEGSADYSTLHIQRCGEILDEYSRTIRSAPERQQALVCVRTAVEALNALNESADHGLIETMEREEICLLVMHVGHALGFNATDEDVTEDWRD